MNRTINTLILVAVAAIIAFSLVVAVSLKHSGAWTVGVLSGLGILAAGFSTLAAVVSMGESWERSAK